MSPGLDELLTGTFVDPEFALFSAEKFARRSPATPPVSSSSITCFFIFVTAPRKLCAGDRNRFRELVVVESKP